MIFNNFSRLKLAYLSLALSLFSLVSFADSSEQDSTTPSSYYLMEASTSATSGDWDIDDNGQADALTDGLMFLRYAFELTGDSLINGLISSDSVYTTSAEIEAELSALVANSGDIDGNGSVDALTDGLLLLRYLFGLTDNALTAGVVGTGATVTESAALESYMSELMPQAPYIQLNGSAFVSHEQATTYNDAGATATDFIDGPVEVNRTGAVDESVAGTYILSYSATDSEGNVSRVLPRSVTVADTTAPAITLLGEPAVEIDIDATYEDAGATATDTVDGSVEVVTTGSVDTSVAATYTLIYTATDNAGNSSTASRDVTVKDVDDTPPVITVTGTNPVMLELGDTYIDEGATANGGEIVTSSGTVDTFTVGSYTITYSATDAAGNTGTATRTVNIKDTTAPVITVSGDNPASVDLDATYTDAGASATDLSGDITVISSGTVDTSIVGTYTITYSATDESGNTATATREVIVEEPRAVVYNVTATYDGGWIYIIDGVSKPELTLEVGTTYTFKYPSSHPLRFSLVRDGIHNGGGEYSQGVDTSGTNQISIIITSSTAKTLYYYCRLHRNQGGKITVTDGTGRIEAGADI
jgi:hypothetical protein